MFQTNTLPLNHTYNQNLLLINLTASSTLHILQNLLKITQIMISFQTPDTLQNPLAVVNLLITISTLMMLTLVVVLTLLTKHIKAFRTFE